MSGVIFKKEEKKKKPDPAIVAIGGLKFPLFSVFKPYYLKEAFNFRPRTRDVVICSYPKSDSKFLDIIVWKLLYPTFAVPPLDPLTNRYIKPMEFGGVPHYPKVFKRLPKLYKTYLPFPYIELDRKVSYIYVVHTPWEACAAYYKFLRQGKDFDYTFEEFFKFFLDGEAGYGSCYQHIMTWIKRCEENNVIVLSHEQIKENPRSVATLIATFLGPHYLRKLLETDDLQDDILRSIEMRQQSSTEKKNLKEYFGIENPIKTSRLRDLADKMREEAAGTTYEEMWRVLLNESNIIIEE